MIHRIKAFVHHIHTDMHCAYHIICSVNIFSWECMIRNGKALWHTRKSLRFVLHCFYHMQTNAITYKYVCTHIHTCIRIVGMSLSCECWKIAEREKRSDKLCIVYVECFYGKFSGIPPYCWHSKKNGVNSRRKKKSSFFFYLFLKTLA